MTKYPVRFPGQSGEGKTESESERERAAAESDRNTASRFKRV